ncbi:MAG: hypothetical protein IKM08_08745 [Clostridia bacterium]|nr:hypothetical protein [Clostridia bacterium]
MDKSVYDSSSTTQFTNPVFLTLPTRAINVPPKKGLKPSAGTPDTSLNTTTDFNQRKGILKSTKKMNEKTLKTGVLCRKKAFCKKLWSFDRRASWSNKQKSVLILRKGLIFWCIKHKFWSE